MTISLPRTLASWQTEAFADSFKREASAIEPAALPLQQLLRYGSTVVEAPQFMILGVHPDGETLRVRTGVFFRSVLAGCSCADDPTPADTYEEYGELEWLIDRDTAEARVLVSE